MLTRRSGDLPREGDELYQNISSVIKPHNIICLLTENLPGQERKPLEIPWMEEIAANNWPTQVLEMLRENT